MLPAVAQMRSVVVDHQIFSWIWLARGKGQKSDDDRWTMPEWV